MPFGELLGLERVVVEGKVGDSKDGEDSLDTDPTSQSSSPPDTWPPEENTNYRS